MSTEATRRAMAEIVTDPAQPSFPTIGNRTVHQYWPRLAAHFQGVLLPPQRRSDDRTVAWSWRQPAEGAAPSAGDLTEVRRRLTLGSSSLTREAADIDDPVSRANLTELASAMKGLTQDLCARPDAELGEFVVRTDTRPMVHSWGSPRAARSFFPDESGFDVSGSLQAGDQPAAGLKVALENRKGSLVGRAVADATGAFHFTKIPPGSYRVRVTSDRLDFPVHGLEVNVEHQAVTGLVLRSRALQVAPESEAASARTPVASPARRRVETASRDPEPAEVPRVSSAAKRRRLVGVLLGGGAAAGIAVWFWSGRPSPPPPSAEPPAPASAAAPSLPVSRPASDPTPADSPPNRPTTNTPTLTPTVTAARIPSTTTQAVAPDRVIGLPGGPPLSAAGVPTSATESPPANVDNRVGQSEPAEVAPPAGTSSGLPAVATPAGAGAAGHGGEIPATPTANAHMSPPPGGAGTPVPIAGAGVAARGSPANEAAAPRPSSAPPPTPRPVSRSATVVTSLPSPSTPPATPKPPTRRPASVSPAAPRPVEASVSAQHAPAPEPIEPGSPPLPGPADRPPVGAASAKETVATVAATPLPADPDPAPAPDAVVRLLRVDGWKPRLVRDAILPTPILLSDETDSSAALRAAALRDLQARMPASIQTSVVLTGLRFAPTPGDSDPAAGWRWDGAADPDHLAETTAKAEQAEILFPARAPAHTLSWVLSDAHGTRLARIAFNPQRQVRLEAKATLRVWLWLTAHADAVDLPPPGAPGSAPRFTWRLTPNAALPADWSVDGNVSAATRRRVDIPLRLEPPMAPRLALALVDRVTGWAACGEVVFPRAPESTPTGAP